ncbi:MAG: peptidylprolyl isomerase, partial [Myxococcota bacterium]|nr:peptidylprolyl isomerase [Myxococcota bacterium]
MSQGSEPLNHRHSLPDGDPAASLSESGTATWSNQEGGHVMWKRRTTLAAGLVTLASMAAGPVAAQGLPPLIPGCQLTLENDPERVLVETPLGTLTLQLFPSVAPVTVDNFLGYIDRGDYTDSIVHRVDPGFVIQAGGFAQIGINFGPIEAQDPIVNEPCISNVAGTIAMAKLSGDPDSATSQWFVNLADNSANLDTQNDGFTVFGRVLGGGLSIAADIANLEDQPPIAPLPPYLTDVDAASGGWEILLASPLLNPLVDAGVHGC